MTTKNSENAETKGSKARPARGRPRRFDPDQLVAAAVPLFWARGYDGVGIADLEALSGMKAPSLYAAFGSKQGLFEQVLKAYTALGGIPTDPRVTGATDPEAMVRAAFEAAVDFYTRRAEAPGCLVMDGCRTSRDAGARSLTSAYRESAALYFRDRFTGFGLAEPGAAAEYVMMVLSGLSGRARDGVSADQLRRSAEAAIAGVGPFLGSGMAAN